MKRGALRTGRRVLFLVLVFSDPLPPVRRDLRDGGVHHDLRGVGEVLGQLLLGVVWSSGNVLVAVGGGALSFAEASPSSAAARLALRNLNPEAPARKLAPEASTGNSLTGPPID